MDFAVPADHRVKEKEGKVLEKYLDLARELEKLCNIKVTVTPIVQSWIERKTEGIRGQGKNGDHPNRRILKIS